MVVVVEAKMATNGDISEVHFNLELKLSGLDSGF